MARHVKDPVNPGCIQPCPGCRSERIVREALEGAMSNQDERKYCESVAREMATSLGDTNPWCERGLYHCGPGECEASWRKKLAMDLLERERAAARAQGRAETLADLAQLTESEGFKHTPVVLRSLASWLEGRRTGGSNG